MTDSVQALKEEIFETLYKGSHFEDSIDEVLAKVGRYFDVSRVYIFENSKDNVYVNNTFEWCNDDILPQIDNLQDIPYKDFNYYDDFDEDGCFFCNDIYSKSQALIDILEPQGIKSMLQFAIMQGGEPRGFVGFDECKIKGEKWELKSEKTDTLLFISKILATFLLKERNLIELEGLVHKLQVETPAFKEFEDKIASDELSFLGMVKINITQNKVLEAVTEREAYDNIDRFKDPYEFMECTKPQVYNNSKSVDSFLSYKALLEAKATGSPYNLEYRRVLNNGEVIWAKTSAFFMDDPKTFDELALVYTYNINEEKFYRIAMETVARKHFDLLMLVDVNRDRITKITLSDAHQELYKDFFAQYDLASISAQEFSSIFFNKYACKNLDRINTMNSYDFLSRRLATRDVFAYPISLRNPKTGTLQRAIYSFAYYDETRTQLLVSRLDITASYLKEISVQDKLTRALKNAEVASEAKTAFLSTVSHDMRTPLNGILGMTSLMQSYVDDERILNDIDSITQSGEYLLSLINDTLDINRIETGKLTLRPIVCEMNESINETIKIIQPNLRNKNLNLDVNVHGMTETLVCVDCGRVRQILMNILGNAIKFSPENGTIKLSFEQGSIKDACQIVTITVTDSGIGMSKEFIEHAFEPFAQEHQKSNTEYIGTGLGLSIVKSLVDLMDGDISIESELGKGTSVSFTLALPLASKEQIKEYRELKSRCSLGNLDEHKRILLCEDHPLNATIAKRLLEKIGISVDVAENGEIGLEKFTSSKEGEYAAILMDIRMPIMDGIEATMAIRSSSHNQAKEIPIIAMTANAYESDIAKCIAAGMNAHLSKPIVPQKLYDTIMQQIN